MMVEDRMVLGVVSDSREAIVASASTHFDIRRCFDRFGHDDY